MTAAYAFLAALAFLAMMSVAGYLGALAFFDLVLQIAGAA